MKNYFNTKFKIAEIINQPLSEIENLPFYEYEFLVDYIKEKNEKEKNSNQSEQTQFEDMKKSYKPPKLNMPKMPKF